jgi:hypothetical protein
MGPRVGLNGTGKPRLHRDSIPRPSGEKPVAIPTKLSRPTRSKVRYENNIRWILTIVNLAKYSGKWEAFVEVVMHFPSL